MRRPLARAVATGALVTAAAALGLTSATGASPGPRQVVAPGAPAPAGAAVVRGATTASFDVMMAPRDPAALTAFLAGLSDPASPDYRHFLTPHQFATRFGASESALSAVSAYLRGFGLSVGAPSAGRIAMRVTGGTGQVARAFGARVQSLLVDGSTGARLVSDATLPSRLAPLVAGVEGLSGVRLVHPQGRVGARATVAGSCPSAGPSTGNTPSAFGGYTVPQQAALYGLSAPYAAGDTGAGQTIALYELGPYSPGDVSTFFQCYGVSPALTPVSVDGGSNGRVSEEATFDIEEAGALAPGAALRVYTGPNNGSGPNDVMLQIADDDVATVVSTSWGDCETDPTNDPAGEQPVFEQMAAQGQTVYAAAGDEGSSDCSGITNNSPAVDDPASQPYVTGVGGLTVSSISPLAETVWNDGVGSGGGAGGGGVSTIWSRPTWQSAPGIAASQAMRMVPDLSAMADPGTSFIEFFTGNASGTCGDCAADWNAIGGTSAGPPLLSALTAVGAQACSVDRLGFLNPTFYAMARQGVGFDDVTTGGNDLFGVGVYPAGAGYDMASGLGSPSATSFLPHLCPVPMSVSTSSIVASPASAPVPGPVTVTLSARDASAQALAGAIVKFSASAPGGVVMFDNQRASSTGTGTAQMSVTADTNGVASVTVTNTAAGTVTVQASNASATLSTSFTLRAFSTAPPGRAGVGRLTAIVGGFTLVATKPSAVGGGAITAYQYRVNGGAWVRFSAVTRTATVRHLARYTIVKVAVRALNAFGAGPASAAKSVRTR